MKWDKDEYRDLKHEIWELIRKELNDHHGKYITVKKLHDSIDNFFFDVLKNAKPHNQNEIFMNENQTIENQIGKDFEIANIAFEEISEFIKKIEDKFFLKCPLPQYIEINDVIWFSQEFLNKNKRQTCRFCENPESIIEKDTCCTGCSILKDKLKNDNITIETCQNDEKSSVSNYNFITMENSHDF